MNTVTAAANSPVAAQLNEAIKNVAAMNTKVGGKRNTRNTRNTRKNRKNRKNRKGSRKGRRSQ